jgi:hypothetical protein
MVDRAARDEYAEVLRHYRAGFLTQRDYVYASARIFRGSFDGALMAVFRQVWAISDHLCAHHRTANHRLQRKAARKVSRWIAYLRSNADYPWLQERWMTSALTLNGLGYCCALVDRLNSAYAVPRLLSGR